MNQLNSLTQTYLKKKIRKILYLVAYSLIIVGFYVGSYFFSKTIFDMISDSFYFYKLSNQRVPCVANSLMYYLG